MSRVRPNTVDECFACGLLRPCEKQHLRPQSVGGGEEWIVPLCISCHDAVDRMSPAEWGIDEVARAMADICRTPDGRRLLLRALRVCHLDQRATA